MKSSRIGVSFAMWDESMRTLAEGVQVSADSRKTGINAHDLVIGPSGAGKTRGYVIPAILQTEGSMIVTDTKGDLYEQVAGPLKSRGYKVLKLDFRNSKESPLGYSALDFLRLEGLDARPNEQDVLSIAAALCPIEDTRDPFWEYAARGVIASMLYYVLSYLPKEEGTLVTLGKLFDTVVDGRYEQLLEDLEWDEPDSFSIHQYAFIRACKDAEKMRGSIFGIVGEKLAIFRFDGMKHLLTRRERVDFASLRNEKTVLIVNVSDCDRSLDRLIALFFQQAFKTLIKGGAAGIPVRVIMDDFAAYSCCIPGFDNLISVVRSRNISVSCMIQSIAQLEALYHEKAATILDNFDTVLYLGGNNPGTARYIAERANKMPWDVLSMDPEDALLIQRGRLPRKVKRYKLEDHPEIANYDSPGDEDGESLVDILDSFEFMDAGIPF